MKKIIYVTGTRAEYGLMEGLLQAIHKNGAFDLSLIITGMHLSKEHGYTADIVRASGIRIAGETGIHTEDSTNAGMARTLGQQINDITNILSKESPDLLLITGDRGEALAAAIAAAHLNIPIAHISGGDITNGATIDERMRHAITRFADLHFAESEKSAANLVAMGENKELVFFVGNPGLSSVQITDEQKTSTLKKYNLDISKPILLVVQHSITTQSQEAGTQMRETLEALKQLQYQTVLVYPNSDAGSEDIIKAIEEYRKEAYLHIYKNIPHNDFLSIMSVVSAMVGNSSAGILEAPSFKLPAVNIGNREVGREHAANTIDTPHERAAIVSAIRKAVSKEFKKTCAFVINPYAQVDAIEKIISILMAVDMDLGLLKKKTVLPNTK